MLLQDNCELNTESIIFGSPNFDSLLNELILLGKRMISVYFILTGRLFTWTVSRRGSLVRKYN